MKAQGTYAGTRTLIRLFAGPVLPRDFVTGKLISTFLICFLQLAILIGFTGGVYRVGWGGSVSGLAALTVALSLAATGYAILLGSLAKRSRIVDSAGVAANWHSWAGAAFRYMSSAEPSSISPKSLLTTGSSAVALTSWRVRDCRLHCTQGRFLLAWV